MPFWFTASTLMTLGMVNLRCSPSSIPARPTIGNVAGVSGLTGKPVVICSRTAACARCRGAAPNASPRINGMCPAAGRGRKGHQRLRHCRQHAALPHDPGECSLALQLQIRIVGPLARISHMWPDEAAGSKVHRGHRVLGAGADTPPFLACSVPTPKWCFQPAGQTGTEEKNGPHQSRRQPSYHAAVPHARYSPQVVFPPSGAHLRELTLKPANFGTAAPQSTTLRAARRWTEKCKTAQTLT